MLTYTRYLLPFIELLYMLYTVMCFVDLVSLDAQQLYDIMPI